METKKLELELTFSVGDNITLVGKSGLVNMSKAQFIKTFGLLEKELCVDITENHLKALRNEFDYIEDPNEREWFVKYEAYELIKSLEELKG